MLGVPDIAVLVIVELVKVLKSYGILSIDTVVFEPEKLVWLRSELLP